ncbi:ectoine/hydroxyectoine ABC transporter substrate-binding protein EhuB [Prauserella muralis]|uniref:Ectoine/hydroxyectoine ABC transporter substrate-binding protein EhuB n=1 Tax=Prauserella muralis TaxID=588067 RepID=A0A2V4ALU5_9PSEU|nr:ectoine/hydroxyectoine ABC transporter substrate-binding protein EhuB [Prauserella muralis]PXY20954.1 ectoine/hydroxyectoine ABC transporter substrate-binding protein EhuB [Prauserella muralis]TWE30016.1 amino acid ABC transporter substrate-binding protein (PAAT family) [Prauserella muralis]
MAHDQWTRRDFFRRSAAFGAVALGGPTLLSACQSTGDGGDALQQARDSGSIRIGIANEQPYGFADSSGNVTGEAPEVAKAVFKALGVNEVENQVVTFNQLIPALNARKYDMVTAGMFITPERCGQAAFSIPDYTALAALLVPRGNPQGVRNFEDLAAKNVQVAVLSGAVEKGYATAAGVDEGNIRTLDTQDSMLRSVADGRVYCAALTDISLKWLVKQNPNVPVEVTESFQPVENGQPVISAGGFVFRKDDDPLREAFNQELRRLHESGEWLRIVEPFGFGEANLPGPDVTTEKLCSA